MRAGARLERHHAGVGLLVVEQALVGGIQRQSQLVLAEAPLAVPRRHLRSGVVGEPAGGRIN